MTEIMPVPRNLNFAVLPAGRLFTEIIGIMPANTAWNMMVTNVLTKSKSIRIKSMTQ